MRIELVKEASVRIIDAVPGDSLMKILAEHGEYLPDTPCGGNGTCGKCRLFIIDGSVSPPDSSEMKLLSPQDLAAGVRLACCVKPEGDIRVAFRNNAGFKVETGFSAWQEAGRNAAEPLLEVVRFRIPEPSLENPADLLERAGAALPRGCEIPFAVRKKISFLGTEASGDALILRGKAISAGGCGAFDGKLMTVAVDIGTTTIAAYLADVSGNQGPVVRRIVSGMNRQRIRGGDVISRIDYCRKNPDGLEELRKCVCYQIRELCGSLVSESGVSAADVRTVVFAGNSTMIHFLCGFDPSGIAVAPFAAADMSLQIVPLKELDIDIFHDAYAVVLPGISSYAGADIAAGVVAEGLDLADGNELFIDIGTNGEMVLASGGRLYACSTAAGPAFEGGNISCGLGGVDGAVYRVKADDGRKLECSVIGDKKPEGLCGSGLIDAVSVFLDKGLIEYSGRITGGSALQIAEGISLNQKDIRELQAAKAAVSAGIKMLMDDAGISAADLDRIILAGGFGSSIEPESAERIGMIPPGTAAKTVAAGNSAGKGALLCSCGRDFLERVESVCRRTEYRELSSYDAFSLEYINQMHFPQSGK